MEKLNWLYRQINLLSLDIATGVVICTLFFARILQAQTKPQGLIVLWLTVWIIYTADHLLDAYKIKGTAATERHRFHQQHFLLLMILLGTAILINLVLIFFIKEVVFQWGVLLIAIVAFYLLLQRYLRLFKEIIAALLYSCGVMLPPLALASMPLDLFKEALLVQFFLTAWFNLVLFSWFDEEKDIRDKHHSFVTAMGHGRTKFFLVTLLFINMAVSIVQLVYRTPWVLPLFILMVMNAILMIIFLNRNWFARHDRFRLLGDSVFLLPVVFLL